MCGCVRGMFLFGFWEIVDRTCLVCVYVLLQVKLEVGIRRIWLNIQIRCTMQIGVCVCLYVCVSLYVCIVSVLV